MTINQREAVTEQYDTVPAGAHTVVAGEHLVPGQEYRPEGAARRLHRWVRHAPHERLPLVSAPVIWTAAEIMHAAAASDWMGPGVVTVLAAARAYAKAARGAARRTASGEHPGLDGAEMGTAVGVPLAWLTAAVKLGPLWGPYDVMTSVFFAGIYTLGYWWWRRREGVLHARAMRDAAAEEAARLAAERARSAAKCADWTKVAPRLGLADSHLMKIVPLEGGAEQWVINLYKAGKLASQVSHRTVAAQLSGEGLMITGGFAVPMSRVEVTPHPKLAYYLLVTFRSTDPWAGGSDLGLVWHPLVSGTLNPELPCAEYFEAQAPSIMDPIVIGRDPERGRPMTITLFDEDGSRRILVLGTSGSGKSMVLDTIRERVTACRDAILIQINLSKGVEDSWWEPLSAASAVKSVHGEAAHARALMILDFIWTIVNTGRKRAPGQRAHKPTPTEPVIVLMIDEVDQCANDEERRAQLGQIASKCRSEGIVLILGSQRPQDIYVGGGMVRSNLTDLVWGALRSTDRRQAGGSYGAELEDITEYAQGVPGVFGIARLPLAEGAGTLRGRAFFWGKTSPGLMAIIEERKAAYGGRPMQVLEPGLEYVAPLWAAVTGQQQQAAAGGQGAALPGGVDEDRYDIVAGRDGSAVSGGHVVHRKLAAVAEALENAIPESLRARMGRSVNAEQAQQAQDQARAWQMPPRDRHLLWKLVSAGDGGLSARDAARQLSARAGRGWSHTAVTRQLRSWEAAGFVVRDEQGRGRSGTRWAAVAGVTPPSMHAVPDQPAPAPAAEAPGQTETAVSATGDVIEPTAVHGPHHDGDVITFTDDEAVMMAAAWGLRAPDLAIARAVAMQGGMSPRLADRAVELLRTDWEFVQSEAQRIARDAGTPVYAWMTRRPPWAAAEPGEDGAGDQADEDEPTATGSGGWSTGSGGW